MYIPCSQILIREILMGWFQTPPNLPGCYSAVTFEETYALPSLQN